MNGSATAAAPVLRIEGLRTYFHTDEGVLKSVDGVDLRIDPCETVALIGESGSGKSVTAQSIMRIVPRPGRIEAGRVVLRPKQGPPVDLAALPESSERLRAIRGGDVAMIFQEPMTSLSPVHTIGNQIVEGIRIHATRDRKHAKALAVEMLARVGIGDPAQRFKAYPHQLSGGMRQRAMIAMALACRPALLIADEPTTALDVTVQAQILQLMQELQGEFGMAILYITHDLGVVAGLADRVCVMYAGRIVETGSTAQLLRAPLHPYTVGLLHAVPRLGKKSREPLATIPGTVPTPLNPPVRCGFAPRCPKMMPGLCDRHVPAMTEIRPGQSVRCFLHSEAREASDHG
jgi:peptide/nickel transport system ATP-binding protein